MVDEQALLGWARKHSSHSSVLCKFPSTSHMRFVPPQVRQELPILVHDAMFYCAGDRDAASERLQIEVFLATSIAFLVKKRYWIRSQQKTLFNRRLPLWNNYFTSIMMSDYSPQDQQRYSIVSYNPAVNDSDEEAFFEMEYAGLTSIALHFSSWLKDMRDRWRALHPSTLYTTMLLSIEYHQDPSRHLLDLPIGE